MITAKGLHKYFKSFHALKGIDLHVEKGEIYGFIGQNGAGKSTTMNILAGLSRPSSGECIVNGKNIKAIRHPGELNIGYLPEEPKFYPWMTAYETLDYLGNGAGKSVSKEKIHEMLEWVGLKDASKRHVGGFSRGMRQRLGIACSLIHDPELLFLDEPSSALDPEGRIDVLRLIMDLKGMGKTIFFSTHILDDVERVCDRVGILSQGNLVLEKPLDKLLSEHISPVFDIVLKQDGFFFAKEKLKTIEGVTNVSVDREKISVTASNADAVSIRLLSFFGAQGIPVVSFAQRKKSLEDIFFSEVNHQ